MSLRNSSEVIQRFVCLKLQTVYCTHCEVISKNKLEKRQIVYIDYGAHNIY